jgi:acetylglutamate kinase
MKVLVKLGGTLLDSAPSRDRLAGEITAAAAHKSIVVVHGGGKQMTRFLEERGVESRFVNGLRVTTDEVLDAVLKIFAGSVNAALVSAFRKAGALPVGLSGLDAGLVDAEQLSPDLGHVGRPVRSDATLLELLTKSGYIPVVACVAGDAQGAAYNVNGDQMASACAAAFGADLLMFLTDVEGVRDAGGATVPLLTSAAAKGLIRDGIASGGMQAKLEAAIGALEHGVREVVIAPGACPDIVAKLIAKDTVGTRVIL